MGEQFATALKIGCDKQPCDVELVGRLSALLLDHVDQCRECLSCGHGALAIRALASIGQAGRSIR